jgi:glycosyltransferase involved in cell wall biosynthesis
MPSARIAAPNLSASEISAPSISVIIPSFNHKAYLAECIDSVLAQQPAPLQVIVVDDGSTDGSLDLLRSYGSRITLLQQANARQAKARNTGLAVAQGDWVAFLDSDDRYRPGRLRAAVAAVQAEPQATLVWSDYASINAQGQHLANHRWQPDARAAKAPSAPSASNPANPANADFARTLIAGNPICNATVTVKRSLLQAIGGFDNRLPRACDGAAWYQLAARGLRFVHIKQELVDYRLHGSNDSKNFAAMTRDRDGALQAAAQAYVQHGVLASPADLAWLRRVLLRQFAFCAAAWVQRRISAGPVSTAQAALLQVLGSDAGLRFFAGLKTGKDLIIQRH